jgi:hypothetical protein
MQQLRFVTSDLYGVFFNGLLQCREQLLGHVATIDQLKTEVKAREDDKAAAQLLLEKERASAAARARAAEDDAAVLTEERAKRQRLEEENKVRRVKEEVPQGGWDHVGARFNPSMQQCFNAGICFLQFPIPRTLCSSSQFPLQLGLCLADLVTHMINHHTDQSGLAHCTVNADVDRQGQSLGQECQHQ